MFINLTSTCTRISNHNLFHTHDDLLDNCTHSGAILYSTFDLNYILYNQICIYNCLVHVLLTLICLGKPKPPPRYILMTFPNIYLGLIFWFSKFKLFMQRHHFFTTRCYFLWISSVGLEGLGETYTFLITHFQFIINNINLFHYICWIWFIHKNI